MNNKTERDMKVIGFANQYYTLWECDTQTTVNERGVRHIRVSNVYLKNISTDWDKVRAQYPDLQLDETLKGHTRSWESNRVEYPDNVFAFGRYEGKLFSEVTDYSYMKWYFEQTHRAAQDELKPILEANGYHVFTYGDGNWGIETQEEYEQKLQDERDRIMMRKIIMEAFEAGELVLFIDCNPNEDGEWIERRSGMTIKFDEVREMSYQGFPYYLPVLNGKAKRVKNKSVKITEAEVDGDIIKVHNFEVLK